MSRKWPKEKISELGSVVSGGTPSTTISEFWKNEVVWITPADLSKINNYKIESSSKQISLKGLKESSANLIPANSIVLSSRAPIGYFAIPSVDFATNQGCKSVVFNEGQDSLFHYYNFKFRVQRFILKGEGTTFAEISKKTVENLEFEKPPLPQQKKIAKILSTCDEVIEQTEAAIAKYQAIKQGMMQDLFTRGIDVETGQLRPTYEQAPDRYKESELGMIPKEWEVMELKECVDNLDGQRVPVKKEDRELLKGEVPYYGASGIIDYVNNYIFNEPLILLGEDGENVLSRVVPLAFKIIGKSWVNNHAHVLKPKENFNIDYLTEYLESLDYRDIISGSAQPKINQANLNRKKLKIAFEDEQLEIAKILNSINSKIVIENKNLMKRFQIKQGLMQDLLTGKVEVAV